jgi:hypothetical protein
MLGRTDGFGQRFFGEVHGLLSHPAIIGDPVITLRRRLLASQ